MGKRIIINMGAGLNRVAVDVAEQPAVAKLVTDLAECYRLSGADTSGGMTGEVNEDWRLAEGAVDAVREAREDYDEASKEAAELQDERDKAVDFIARMGYRRCDAPACNCGSWHGGHALTRLHEIRAEVWGTDVELNGVTLLGGVKALIASRARALDLAATLRTIMAARDHLAEGGAPLFPDTQSFDDWAADQAQAALVKAGQCPVCGSSTHECETGDPGCLHCDNLNCTWTQPPR
jgi:hypothetical protein